MIAPPGARFRSAHPAANLALLCLSVCFFQSGCSKPTSSGSPAAIDPVARMTAIAGIEARIDALASADSAQLTTQLVAYLKSLYVMSDAGVAADGTIWAVFTDGRGYQYIHNRPPDPAVEGSPRSPRFRSPVLTSPLANTFPTANEFRIFNSLEYPWRNYQDSVAGYLSDAGYARARVPFIASSMKSLPMQGIYVFHAHCGEARIRYASGASVALRALWTAEPVNAATDTLAYKDDLDAGRIVYSTADSGVTAAQGAYHVTHYAITSRFFDTYLADPSAIDTLRTSPSKGGLVYLGACSSADLTLAQSFMNKGATAVLGWTYTTTDRADANAAQYLFDHLLGRNGFKLAGAGETPPQRPFNLGDVLAEMERKQFDRDPSTGALLYLYEQQGNDASAYLIAPTIRSVEFLAGYPGRARLLGAFANGGPLAPPPQAVLAGIPLQTARYAPAVGGTLDTLEVDIPGTVAGGQTWGSLVVMNGNVGSNSVPISDWRGQVTVKEKLDPGCFATLVFTLHVRGDVHAVRDQAGVDPTVPGRSMSVASDSKCEYSFSGIYVVPSGGGTRTYSGSGSLPITYLSGQAAPYFRPTAYYAGKDVSVDGMNNYIQLELQNLNGASGTLTTRDAGGNTTVDRVDFLLGFGSVLWHLDSLSYAALPDTGEGPDSFASVSWPQIPCSGAPTALTASKGGRIRLQSRVADTAGRASATTVPGRRAR